MRRTWRKKGWRRPSTLRKLPSLDSLLSPSPLQPPQLHDPTGSKHPLWRQVIIQVSSSSPFRLSLFINIISALRIYLGPNSGICHSKFIRGRKPLNSIGIQRWRMKQSCLETFNSIWCRTKIRGCVSSFTMRCAPISFLSRTLHLLDQVFFICELGWRICWRQF